MSELQIRSWAFEHAEKICGTGAPVTEILAAAEMILIFLTEDRSTLETTH